MPLLLLFYCRSLLYTVLFSSDSIYWSLPFLPIPTQQKNFEEEKRLSFCLPPTYILTFTNVSRLKEEAVHFRNDLRTSSIDLFLLSRSPTNISTLMRTCFHTQQSLDIWLIEIFCESKNVQKSNLSLLRNVFSCSKVNTYLDEIDKDDI